MHFEFEHDGTKYMLAVWDEWHGPMLVGRIHQRTDHSDGSYSAGDYPWRFHGGEFHCAPLLAPEVKDYFCRCLKNKAFW